MCHTHFLVVDFVSPESFTLTRGKTWVSSKTFMAMFKPMNGRLAAGNALLLLKLDVKY